MLTSAQLTALRSFLLTTVVNYEQLQLLLLLYRRRPEALTARSLGAELNVDEDSARTALAELVRHGLVAASGAALTAEYRFVATGEMEARVELLEVADREHRIQLVELMTQAALARVRSSAFLTFAEVFRLGGKKK